MGGRRRSMEPVPSEERVGRFNLESTSRRLQPFAVALTHRLTYRTRPLRSHSSCHGYQLVAELTGSFGDLRS